MMAKWSSAFEAKALRRRSLVESCWEPELDLVEPVAVRGREAEPEKGVRGEPVLRFRRSSQPQPGQRSATTDRRGREVPGTA